MADNFGTFLDKLDAELLPDGQKLKLLDDYRYRGSESGAARGLIARASRLPALRSPRFYTGARFGLPAYPAPIKERGR